MITAPAPGFVHWQCYSDGLTSERLSDTLLAVCDWLGSHNMLASDIKVGITKFMLSSSGRWTDAYRYLRLTAAARKRLPDMLADMSNFSLTVAALRWEGNPTFLSLTRAPGLHPEMAATGFMMAVVCPSPPDEFEAQREFLIATAAKAECTYAFIRPTQYVQATTPAAEVYPLEYENGGRYTVAPRETIRGVFLDNVLSEGHASRRPAPAPPPWRTRELRSPSSRSLQHVYLSGGLRHPTADEQAAIMRAWEPLLPSKLYPPDHDPSVR